MIGHNSEIKSKPQQCGCNECSISECKCEPGCINCDCASYLPKWFCWTWPSSMWWWIFWSMGAVLLGFGLVSSIASLSLNQSRVGLAPLIISVPGLLIMGFASPNPFKQMMDGFVPDIEEGVWNVDPKPPLDSSQWHLNRLEWDEKVKEWLPNPLARYEQDGPSIMVNQDDEEWVVYLDGNEEERFESESEASKQIEKFVKKSDKLDAQEMIFAEHPRHNRFRALYNATPPQFTSSFFFYIFAVLFLMGSFFGIPSIERNEKLIIFVSLIILGAVLLILSYFNNKKVMEAWDTVTSIVKFIDAGHNELVGQVRPINDTPPKILHVDGCKDKSWTFRNVVAWSWSYHATEKWTETYTDTKGRLRTRTCTETRYVRGGSHASDYMLHDGTGGILVKTSTFSDLSMGPEIWSSGTRGKKGCGGYATPRRGGRMIKHNWSLHAITFGDPTYAMARVTNRPHDEIPRGTVAENASRVHHTLMAIGEDAPRRHARILKGTEFSVLKPKASVFGNFGPSALLIISTLVVLMTVL